MPLLLVGTIPVLALTRAVAKPLLTKLVIASALMIALDYPARRQRSGGRADAGRAGAAAGRLFFLLVTLLVTDGLFLATDARAPARARALLHRPRRRRVASQA